MTLDTVLFRPSVRITAAAAADDTVRLWDPTTGTPVGDPLTGHTHSVTAVGFGTLPDGRLLLATATATATAASGYDDTNTVRMWDPPPAPPSATR